MLGGYVDFLEILPHFRRNLPLHFREPRDAEDDVHRRADLVRHPGKEFALGAAGGIGFQLADVRGDDPLHLGDERTLLLFQRTLTACAHHTARKVSPLVHCGKEGFLPLPQAEEAAQLRRKIRRARFDQIRIPEQRLRRAALLFHIMEGCFRCDVRSAPVPGIRRARHEKIAVEQQNIYPREAEVPSKLSEQDGDRLRHALAVRLFKELEGKRYDTFVRLAVGVPDSPGRGASVPRRFLFLRRQRLIQHGPAAQYFGAVERLLRVGEQLRIARSRFCTGDPDRKSQQRTFPRIERRGVRAQLLREAQRRFRRSPGAPEQERVGADARGKIALRLRARKQVSGLFQKRIAKQRPMHVIEHRKSVDVQYQHAADCAFIQQLPHMNGGGVRIPEAGARVALLRLHFPDRLGFFVMDIRQTADDLRRLAILVQEHAAFKLHPAIYAGFFIADAPLRHTAAVSEKEHLQPFAILGRAPIPLRKHFPEMRERALLQRRLRLVPEEIVEHQRVVRMIVFEDRAGRALERAEITFPLLEQLLLVGPLPLIELPDHVRQLVDLPHAEAFRARFFDKRAGTDARRQLMDGAGNLLRGDIDQDQAQHKRDRNRELHMVCELPAAAEQNLLVRKADHRPLLF